MTFLTQVAWLSVGAALVASGSVVFGPHVGDVMEDAAEAFLRWRRRTSIARLARRTRHQEARRG